MLFVLQVVWPAHRASAPPVEEARPSRKWFSELLDFFNKLGREKQNERQYPDKSMEDSHSQSSIYPCLKKQLFTHSTAKQNVWNSVHYSAIDR